MGEGAPPDEGAAVQRDHVGGLVDEARERLQLLQVTGREAGTPQLELQNGDDARQIGIAAALPVAVDRAVHHDGSGPHPRDAVRHGQPAVVVGVDAEPDAAEPGAHLFDGGLDLVRQPPPVGVAEDDHVRTPGGGRGEGLQGVVAVPGQPVEEVLRIVDHLAAVAAQVGDRLPDHGEILRKAAADHLADVQVPALAENGDHRRFARNQRSELIVRLGAQARTPGAAEGGQAGAPEPGRTGQLEEVQIPRVRTRPAPFDVVHAEIVEALGDLELLLGAEGDALALGPVAQGGVVDQDRFHGSLPRVRLRLDPAICGSRGAGSARPRRPATSPSRAWPRARG